MSSSEEDDDDYGANVGGAYADADDDSSEEEGFYNEGGGGGNEDEEGNGGDDASSDEDDDEEDEEGEGDGEESGEGSMEDYGEEANAAHGEDYGHEETNSSADQDQEQRDEEVEGGGEREHEEDAGRAAFLSQSEELHRSAGGLNAQQQPEEPPFHFDQMVSGALAGFGGGSMGAIAGQLAALTGGGGGGGGNPLTNILAGGGLEGAAAGLIASAAHHFVGVSPDTGRILGAIAGNLIFGLGGRDNSLGGIGKILLDNLLSGRFHRPVEPYISPTLPYFNLNFQAERDRCLRERRLFEDPEFPAADAALYYSRSPPKRVEWIRPGQLVHDPQLLVGRQSRFDVCQGELGDCWLLAATANLTLRDELFHRVVPPDQSFTENYAGIFHFQFWRYGRWVDVVIDDRLPTHAGELLYMHSRANNAFWSALLEKAYAKLYGSYEALKGGTTTEALEDFTGGLTEHLVLRDVPREHMLALLVRGFQMGSLFGCSINADPDVTEARLDNGLIRGHAYSITALHTVKTVAGGDQNTVLVRIRNPWGESEWKGRWSDGSAEWRAVADHERQQMGVSFGEDGEFWMEFGDFCHHFEEVEICNLGPEVMNEISQMLDPDADKLTRRPESAWTAYAADGQWSRQAGTAGGCKNNATFADNPQFGALIQVDGAVHHLDADGRTTLITAVLQKYRRELRCRGLDDLPIGFAVYAIDGDGSGGDHDNNGLQLQGAVGGGGGGRGVGGLMAAAAGRQQKTSTAAAPSAPPLDSPQAPPTPPSYYGNPASYGGGGGQPPPRQQQGYACSGGYPAGGGYGYGPGYGGGSGYGYGPGYPATAVAAAQPPAGGQQIGGPPPPYATAMGYGGQGYGSGGHGQQPAGNGGQQQTGYGGQSYGSQQQQPGYGGQGYGNQHQQPDYGSQQQPGYGSKVYGTPHGPGASLPAEVQHQQQPLAMHRLDRGFFDNATPVAKGPAFVDLREVTARFRLRPGRYVVVASTFDPGQDGEFLMRVFCTGRIQAGELNP